MNLSSNDDAANLTYKIDPSLAGIFIRCTKSDATLEKEALEAIVRESFLSTENLPLAVTKNPPIDSRHGVTRILEKGVDAEAAKMISTLCEPYLKPGTVCTYTDLQDIPKALHYLHPEAILEIENRLEEYAASNLKTDGQIADFLSYSDYEIRSLAKTLAGEWGESAQEKLVESEKLLGYRIRGDSFESRYARICDAKFWRRALTTCITRGREHFFLRMSLICKKREAYVSNHSVDMRDQQLKRQRDWMRSTIVVPVHDTAMTRPKKDGNTELSLADLAIGPEERFAKLYTFIHAIDQLGVEANLSSAMITITLEPEWHPNPANGVNQWNGSSPRAAHQSFSKRWQSVLRDLHRIGIRLSGFRVAEPHKDGCPHYHIWTLYRLDDELDILSTIMKYFPLKLKIRTPHRKGENRSHLDKIFETRLKLLDGKSRAAISPKEGAQVELSRIDRAISTGASYALKYVLKSFSVSGDAPGGVIDKALLNDLGKSKTEQKVKTAKRVDTYRTVWGIHQGQLFGISKCLTVWDEFRRMTIRPKNKVLKRLWRLARGSNSCGRVAAGAGQRGDARAFLKMLGGLDAAKTKNDANKQRFVLGRLVEAAKNRYGDTIKKTTGVLLMSKQRIKMKTCKIETRIKKSSNATRLRTETISIASIKTRTVEWKFVKKQIFQVPKKQVQTSQVFPLRLESL